MPKHKWLLYYEPSVAKQIAKLPDRDIRQAVFNSIANLLRQDNPTSPEVGAAKIDELGGIWRIHVDVKQYTYRVLYSIETGTMVYQEIEYKGRLLIHQVRAKKDRPY